MQWVHYMRPGQAGTNRDNLVKGYNSSFGEGNWRMVWEWDKEIIARREAVKIYEEGYFADSFNREGIWIALLSSASEVYDFKPEDVASGLDYEVQNGTATHLQDIAIRNVVNRRGWEFNGRELVQIRGKTEWGLKLDPGKVPFHKPHLIVQPALVKWWDKNSVEDFYQSNKFLQTKWKA